MLLAGLFQVVGARQAAEEPAVYRPLGVLAYALLLIGPVALVWRR
jgi:hypothetical protein